MQLSVRELFRLSSTRARNGFTLIELLVVIAIIGLLAAILFPVFSRARENARRSSCLSNVKQICLGYMQYTQDFDERVPILISTDIGEWAWTLRVQPYIKSKQVFRCPSDTNTTVRLQSGAPSSERFPTSYAATIYSASGGLGALNVAGISLSQVVQPSSTIYLSDAGARSAGASGVQLDSEGKPVLQKPGCPLLAAPHSTAATSTTDMNWCGPNPRHLGMTNVAFFDGHAKAMKVETWYYSLNPSSGVYRAPWMDPTIGG